jgi:fatty acid desaturase
MAEYFDGEHRRGVAVLLASFTARSEWPTWLLIVVIYGAWSGTLWLLHAKVIGLVGATPLLIVCGAWYMSLQHELMHGHPTRLRWLNKLIGYAPIAVWYPYTLYCDTHLTHHRDEDLTVPGIDPECNYVDAKTWQAMSPLMRALWQARKTFLGRFVIGPPMAVISLGIETGRQWLAGDWRYLRMWLTHGTLLVAMLAWMQHWAGIPAWYYLFAIGWPALSIAMIRSFYEHRAVPEAKARIAINEAGWLMRLLFLNNNYHLVHHDVQQLPWYLLPTVYRMREGEYRKKCGGFHIAGGYAELLRRYAFKRTDAPLHPFADTLAEIKLGKRPVIGQREFE